MRQLPNLLGLFRIITTPLLAWLILVATPTAYVGAAFLLLIMALSDMADGRLARHLKVVSPLGIFIDTISDKIFVAGVIIPMIEVGLLPAWVALAIIIREFVVSGLRSFAAAEGVVISARRFGKQKLVITVVALIWRLLAANAEADGFLGQLAGGILIPILDLWVVSMGLALVWTLGSGIEYLWQAWPLLRRGWAPTPSGR
ncbi:CDP-alcohol phosphatidyltransferase family protein [Chloroflexus aggregans]|uniref:CDP-alcohol phosphatidyltransferase n=1 Tax=Chloroflexus aggregans (strain MD-66 / DSM 9485) TaxID=326427 RepID=B8G4V3_CHLAD|nr:CDP-alcohol phosphatidyltransferase family protein [Chloroflexus aggregans]ACL23586.1 CDP-alcohol phosphatidyltransferase [Chloroflexus aggregans DSM 9485]